MGLMCTIWCRMYNGSKSYIKNGTKLGGQRCLTFIRSFFASQTR